MSKIAVAIYDAQNLISLDGIEAMLLLKEDFEVTGKFSSCQEVIASLRTTVMNVLIVTLYTMKEEELALIKKIRDEHPNIRVLVLAMEHDKSLLFRIIKTGAKGYLTPNAQRQEIYEAILSLRGGYEYYSKTITDLLLKGYIDIIQGDDDKQRNTKTVSYTHLDVYKRQAH